MSPRQWCALLMFYAAYLIFGASIFYHMERGYEIERRLVQLQERIDINELLTKYTAPDDDAIQKDILDKVSTYCGKAVTNHTMDEYMDPYQWSFYHSVFFAFTVCSTLGYGNIAPTQTFSRYFMILYALVGIPVNGILYAYLGDYFGETFIGAYNRYKAYKMANNKNYVPRRWGMIAQITLYLVPAAVVLIFLPACLFTYFEDWPYSVSVYYSFVTLSTIGFGDYIPTFQPHQERVFGIYFKFYQAFIIIWFVFGLSYLLMLISFIARGMRSKQISRLEHQLSENIKLTHQRIWTGVTKDVSYLRRIFNEIYMMRFKPVYADEEDGYVYNMLTRSESCPTLEMYHPKYLTGPLRKRAYSEHAIDETIEVAGQVASLHRSDTDLIRIDKQRTYDPTNTNTSINTGDVLARVVQALGKIGMFEPSEADPRGGIHGFSDSQILAEESSLSGSECPTPPIRPRVRAVSDFRGGYEMATADNQHEWTWSGTQEQIQELRKMRAKMAKPNELFRQAVAGNKQLGSHTINIEVTPPKTDTPNPVKRSLFSKILPHKLLTGAGGGGEHQQSAAIPFDPPQDARRYLEVTDRGRDSSNSLRKQYLNATSRGRPSIFTATECPEQDLLEKTTIADLIRALEVAHIQDNTPETLLVQSSPQPPPATGHTSRFLVEKTLGPGLVPGLGRRSSMFPVSVNVDHARPTFAEEPEKAAEVHPTPSKAAAGRRASMFPANFKTFQKLTENILSEQFPTPVGAQRLLPTEFSGGRRASMLPRRISPAGERPIQSSGRRVSLIPGAGRHVIPERLLREYAHVPQETRDLGRTLSQRSRPQSHYINVPIGGAFALSLAAAHPGGIGAPRRKSMRPSPLARNQSQSASSPHLSVRRDSQHGVGAGPKTKNLRSVFRPFGGEDEAVPESAHSDSSSESSAKTDGAK